MGGLGSFGSALKRPGVACRRRLRLAVRGALVGAAACTAASCYPLRIDESFWLRPRPGQAVDRASTLARLPDGYTLNGFTVAAGATGLISGVVAARPDATVTVLFLGGDDFVVARQGVAALQALTSAPANVVLLDYPGYGVSPGQPTLVTIERAAIAVHDWLCEQEELALTKIVVYGHSMGSFVAAALADVRRVDGLVLQGSATNLTDWVHAFFRPSRFKWWARPAYPFIRISLAPDLARQDNVARLRRYRGPLLVLSGTADDKAAPEMSRALAHAAATPDSLKQLVLLPGAGHEDLFTHAGFLSAYRAFITLVAGAGASYGCRPANEWS
jgi:uncharacterized protein